MNNNDLKALSPCTNDSINITFSCRNPPLESYWRTEWVIHSMCQMPAIGTFMMKLNFDTFADTGCECTFRKDRGCTLFKVRSPSTTITATAIDASDRLLWSLWGVQMAWQWKRLNLRMGCLDFNERIHTKKKKKRTNSEQNEIWNILHLRWINLINSSLFSLQTVRLNS